MRLLSHERYPTTFGYTEAQLKTFSLSRLAALTGIPRNTLRYRLQVKKTTIKNAITHTPYGR